MVGAKLLAWAEAWPVFWAHFPEVGFLGGKTIVGGLLGGLGGLRRLVATA